MPYEISFKKVVPVENPDDYINECCIGGDVVVKRLLPDVKRQFESVESEQEDWGWFIWFKRGPISLAIDVFTDDPKTGEFRMHLTARKKRWWLFDSVVDSPELEEVKDLVEKRLSGWTQGVPGIRRVDENYLPVNGESHISE